MATYDITEPMDDGDIDELVDRCRSRNYVHLCERGYDDEANKHYIHLQATRCPLPMMHRINFDKVKVHHLDTMEIDGKPHFDLFVYIRKRIR